MTGIALAILRARGTFALLNCMADRVTTRVVVAGAADTLGAYRRQVNALLDEEYGGNYRELHTPGRLEYEVRTPAGAPFPQFVTASADFPELVVELSWTKGAGGERGSATVQGGKLLEHAAQDPVAGGSLAIEARAGADGTLELALATRARADGSWIGYAVTATQHAFFLMRGDGAARELSASDGVEPEWAERWRIGAGAATAGGAAAAYAELDPREPIDAALLDELDRLANEFADGWIWFAAAPAAETAIERHRYELHGLKVNEANLRAERLRGTMARTAEGYAFDGLSEAARPVAALVARHWLAAAGAGAG